MKRERQRERSHMNLIPRLQDLSVGSPARSYRRLQTISSSMSTSQRLINSSSFLPLTYYQRHVFSFHFHFSFLFLDITLLFSSYVYLICITQKPMIEFTSLSLEAVINNEIIPRTYERRVLRFLTDKHSSLSRR